MLSVGDRSVRLGSVFPRCPGGGAGEGAVCDVGRAAAQFVVIWGGKGGVVQQTGFYSAVVEQTVFYKELSNELSCIQQSAAPVIHPTIAISHARDREAPDRGDTR